MTSQSNVRRARIGVALVFACHGAVTGSFAARIPALQDRLHLSAAVLGAALIMPATGAILALLLAGRMVHRYGSGRACRVLLPLWGLSLMLPALAPNVGILFAGFIVYGITAGLADVAMNAQGVIVERSLGRSIMSGLHGMWSVGALVASAVGAVIAHAHIDARLHLVSAALVIASVACVVTLPLLRDADGRATMDAGDEPPRLALPKGPVLLIGLVAFCAIFAEGSGTDWAAVFLHRVTGTDAGTAAAAYTTFVTTMAVGRLSGDAVVRRVGAVATVRAAAIAGTVGALVVATAQSAAQAFVGFALLGLGVAVVVPLAFAAGGHAGRHAGHGIAAVATISYGAGIGAPGIVGAVAQATSLRVAFVLIGLLVGLVAMGAGTLRAANVDEGDAELIEREAAVASDTLG